MPERDARVRWVALASLCVTAVLSSTAGVAAQEGDDDSVWPSQLDHVGPTWGVPLGVEGGARISVAGTGGGPETTGVSGLGYRLEFALRVIPEVVAWIDWGLFLGEVWVQGEFDSGSEVEAFAQTGLEVAAGNPVIGIGYAGRPARGFELQVGFMVGVPQGARSLAGTDVDSAASRARSETIYRGAIAFEGYFSPWRWAPERFTLVLPVHLGYRAGPVVLFGQLSAAAMIPILGDRGLDVSAVLQGAAGASVYVIDEVSLGAQLQLVGDFNGILLSSPALGIAPVVRWDPDDNLVLVLRGQWTLTGPDRALGPRGPGFGVFLHAGVRVN